MQTKERNAVFSLATIMSFRMLGLFMILPVFALYIKQIPNATPSLIGIALGVYGLTQAALQIPFGSLSDHIGRKKVIATGLILFAIGSVVAALAHNISGIILGRALQGAGAIGSTTLAMVSDVTRDEERSKAMAIIGMAIAMSFTLAIVLGPALNAWIKLSGLFWVTAALAVVGLSILSVIPKPPKPIIHALQGPKSRFRDVIKNTQLLRLDFGIMALHCTLTASFLAIPIMLHRMAELSEHQQVWLYLVIMILAFTLALPLIIISEKKRVLKPFFMAAIVILGVCELLLIIPNQSTVSIGVILIFYFVAFTLLEASLPSLVSKIAPIRNKGAAMGIFSSSQFFGIFVGGAVGGWIFSCFQFLGLFIFCCILTLIWLIFAATMRQPPYLSSIQISINTMNAEDTKQLSQVLLNTSGVSEAALSPQENLIYLKIDKKIITEDELRKIIRAGNLVA